MRKWLRIIGKLALILFILFNIITALHAWHFTHFYDRTEGAPAVASHKPGAGFSWELITGFKSYKLKNDPAPEGAETVYLKTADGVRLHAWMIRSAQPHQGTVLLFHGHGSNKSAVKQEAERFRELGYHTLLVDFRAHGSSSGNTCTIGYQEAEDVKAAYMFVRGEEKQQVILWGISMGAASITRAVAVFRLRPDKVILEMPFGSLLDAVEGRMRMMKLPGEPAGVFLTFWGGLERGFWAFRHEPVAYAASMGMPVLLQWGANDLRVSRNETEALYQALPGKKEWVVYDSCAHESLCKKESVKWRQTVTRFLLQP